MRSCRKGLAGNEILPEGSCRQWDLAGKGFSGKILPEKGFSGNPLLPERALLAIAGLPAISGRLYD
jgi:hypothetical protein